jgi:predicted SAM-dependent methyltransferase
MFKQWIKRRFGQRKWYHSLQRIYLKWRHIRHQLFRGGRRRNRIVLHYLTTHTVRKLHFSSGERQLPGWLNTDLYVGDIYLNALAPFPLPPASFDAIYSHHVIEHFSLADLARIFGQFLRILKPGGRIRLVTPSLEALITAYREGGSTLVRHYCAQEPLATPAVAFNTLMFNGTEHRFVFDEKTLSELLSEVGFSDIRFYPYNQSEDPRFAGIDDHGYAFIAQLSLAVEATRGA